MAFETEIFIPSYHYDDTGLEILVSDGDWRYVKERQTLYYRHQNMQPGAVHSVRIKPVTGPLTAVAAHSNGSTQSLTRPAHLRNRSQLSMKQDTSFDDEESSEPPKPESSTCSVM